MIIESAMNEDNNWLTFSSLLYIMQLPSIYFDVLEIMGCLEWYIILWYEMNIKNSCIKGIRVSGVLECLNPMLLLRSWAYLPPGPFLLFWENTVLT